MIRIRYDDRERFPWVLEYKINSGWRIWSKYRMRIGAERDHKRLSKLLEEIEDDQDKTR